MKMTRKQFYTKLLAEFCSAMVVQREYAADQQRLQAKIDNLRFELEE